MTTGLQSQMEEKSLTGHKHSIAKFTAMHGPIRFVISSEGR